MSKIDTLLSALDRVKNTGRGQFVACCPAHDDRSPSLSISEGDDGRILLHCFAGCSVEEILSAVGLTFSDLFPDQCRGHHQRTMRSPFNSKDILAAMAQEALIVAAAAASISDGNQISDDDRERVILAASRLKAAADLANG